MTESTDFPTRTQAAETRRNKGTGLRQTPQETQTKAEAQESAGGAGMPTHGQAAGAAVRVGPD